MLEVLHKNIQRLSGAVSLRFLRPITDEMPLLLILGDLHKTSSGACAGCSCDYSVESCCYRSYDRELLQLLDHLSSSEKSINIFVETYSRFIHMDDDLYQTRIERAKFIRDVYFKKFPKHVDQQLPSMYVNNQVCFMNLGDRTAYNRFCPTRNIKWHFADVRVKSHLTSVEPRTNNERAYGIEFKLVELVHSLQSQFMSKKIPPDEAKIEPHHVNVVPLLLLFIKLALEPTNVDVAERLYTDVFVKSKSQVYKQLSKFEAASGVSMKDKVIAFLMYIAGKNTIMYGTVLNLVVLPKLHDALQHGDRTVRVKASWNELDHAFTKLISLTSCLMDLYVFFRMMKYNDKTWLNLLVAGEEHCENFTYFITEICGWYEVDQEIKRDFTKKHYQCIDLSSININLNDEAERYGVPAPTFSPSLYKDLEDPRDIDSARLQYLGAEMFNGIIQGLVTLNNIFTILDVIEGRRSGLDRDEIMLIIKLEDFIKQAKLRRELNTLLVKDVMSVYDIDGVITDMLSGFQYNIASPTIGLASIDFDKLLRASQQNNAMLPVIIKLLQQPHLINMNTMSSAIDLDEPELALLIYDRLTKKFMFDAVEDATTFVRHILMKIKQQHLSNSKVEYDAFDTYLPILRSFRGHLRQDSLGMQELLEWATTEHPKFKQAYEAGMFARTIDDLQAPHRPHVRRQS